jgi:hypothetical protein
MLNSTQEPFAGTPEKKPLNLPKFAEQLDDLHSDMEGLNSLLQVYEEKVAIDAIKKLKQEGASALDFVEEALGSFWELGEGKALRFLITTHVQQTRRLAALVEQAEAHPVCPEKEGAAYDAIKAVLRNCFEAWRDYDSDDGEKSVEADQVIERFNPLSLAVAIAKLIIAKGTEINSELKQEAFCDRLEAEAAAAGLEWFGLRELYDEYFPGVAP